MLVQGIHGAFNPTLRAFNLRQNFGPVAQHVLGPLFDFLGLTPPTVCAPVAQTCEQIIALSAGSPSTIDVPPTTTPIDDLVSLLGAPTQVPAPAPSTADRIADGAGALGGFLRSAAAAAVGAA